MIAILKYNAGNIRSVQNALKRLGYESLITDNPEDLLKADKVIFPGVGEANSAMRYLKKKGLDDLLRSLDQPVLGICLGLQLMCSYTEEGDTSCLGIFPNKVVKFEGDAIIPHMGWNDVKATNGVLFKEIDPQGNVYFVHSYYAEVGEFTTALCNYIQPFSAAIEKDNFYATQFHPEKSGSIGTTILKNFLEL
jgi:imidazole glycerol-phosphate synthase subunit HisH